MIVQIQELWIMELNIYDSDDIESHMIVMISTMIMTIITITTMKKLYLLIIFNSYLISLKLL